MTDTSAKQLGQKLLSVAVIADSHVNPGEFESDSPFAVNRLANRRLRHVIHDINQRAVDLTIHLGDLVHPVPGRPELYDQAAAHFHRQTKDLQSPLHVIPGNHDVGDKPVAWAPAGVVNDQFLALWDKTFGPGWKAFDNGGCRFILINASLFNSGLAAEAQQRRWLEAELADHGRARRFLFIHYPPYLCDPGENEHYDNIGEPGRSWLLRWMEQARVEALFAGHVHNFWYHRHGETRCYLLPATSFVRHDYHDAITASPPAASEFGRNDAAKLGYMILDIHENGHLCHVVRSAGAERAADDAGARPPGRLQPPPPLAAGRTPLGFDLRQDWAGVHHIAPGGGVDEFDRKRARNDYPLMALWEMGLRDLRIPRSDLEDPATRKRMADLRDRGHRFTLYSFGLPDARLRRLVGDSRDLLRSWEITVAEAELPQLAERLDGWRGPDIFASRLRLKKDTVQSGDQYFHVINHGWLPTERDSITDALDRAGLRGRVKGLVFRLGCGMDPWQTLVDTEALNAEMDIDASLLLRLADNNPARARMDSLWTANRLAVGLAAGFAHRRCRLFADTLIHVDRGYLPRLGALDRHCNPAEGARVIGHLQALLDRPDIQWKAGRHGRLPHGRYVELTAKPTRLVLLLPDRTGAPMTLEQVKAAGLGARPGRWVDLVGGHMDAPKAMPNGLSGPAALLFEGKEAVFPSTEN